MQWGAAAQRMCRASAVLSTLSLDPAYPAGARQAPPIWHDWVRDRLRTPSLGSIRLLANCPPWKQGCAHVLRAFLPRWIDVGRPSTAAPVSRLLGECLLVTGSPAKTRLGSSVGCATCLDCPQTACLAGQRASMILAIIFDGRMVNQAAKEFTGLSIGDGPEQVPFAAAGHNPLRLVAIRLELLPQLVNV